MNIIKVGYILCYLMQLYVLRNNDEKILRGEHKSEVSDDDQVPSEDVGVRL